MTLPAGFAGDVQLITLIAGYVFILCKASGWVGEGSELLLLIPSVSGIVGSVVLPIAGQLPDAAVVLFSGMGERCSEAATPA